MKKVCSELISFFKNEEGWDKKELVEEYVQKIMKEAKSELTSGNELTVHDGESAIMELDDFATRLFDKIIEGVCNVIRTT